MVKRATLTGAVERAVLGLAMSSLAFAAEWLLSRRMRRRSSGSASADQGR